MKQRICDICDSPFTRKGRGGTNAKRCSEKCRKTAERRAERRRIRIRPRPQPKPPQACATCDAEFVPRNSRHKNCNKRCSTKHLQQIRDKAYTPKTDSGDIYVIQCPLTDILRIGHSTDVAYRLYQHNMQNPVDHTIIALKPANLRSETALHRALKDHVLPRRKSYYPTTPAVLDVLIEHALTTCYRQITPSATPAKATA